MKTRFVIGAYIVLISAAAVQLGCSHHKIANLDLVIQGPFVICEQPSELAIAIPNLEGNHYVPGLTAGLFEYPLTQGEQYPPYTHYTLTLPHPGGGGMKVVSSKGSPRLYTEKGGKDSCDLSKASIVIAVPKPDEIWPLGTGGETGTVWDTAPTTPGVGNGSPMGGCTDCAFSNKLVLRYRRTDIDGINILCDKGTTDKDSTDKTTCSYYFPPNKTFKVPPLHSTLVKMGDEATLGLDAQPVIIDKDGVSLHHPSGCKDIEVADGSGKEQEMKEEESEAFCASTAMGVNARYYISAVSQGKLASIRRDCGSNVVFIAAQ